MADSEPLESFYREIEHSDYRNREQIRSLARRAWEAGRAVGLTAVTQTAPLRRPAEPCHGHIMVTGGVRAVPVRPPMRVRRFGALDEEGIVLAHLNRPHPRGTQCLLVAWGGSSQPVNGVPYRAEDVVVAPDARPIPAPPGGFNYITSDDEATLQSVAQKQIAAIEREDIRRAKEDRPIPTDYLDRPADDDVPTATAPDADVRMAGIRDRHAPLPNSAAATNAAVMKLARQANEALHAAEVDDVPVATSRDMVTAHMPDLQPGDVVVSNRPTSIIDGVAEGDGKVLMTLDQLRPGVYTGVYRGEGVADLNTDGFVASDYPAPGELADHHRRLHATEVADAGHTELCDSPWGHAGRCRQGSAD